MQAHQADQEQAGGNGLKAASIAIFILILVIHVIAQVDRNLLSGYSQQITGELGISNAEYGFLSGAVWAPSYGIMAVLLGSIADRHNRYRVIACGLLAWSACTVASGFAQNLQQMALARFLVASGEAALVPAAVSLIMDLFKGRQVGTYIGIFFACIPLGLGFSFALAGTLDASLGWRGTYQLLGLLGVLIGLPLLAMRDSRDTAVASERGAPVGQQMRDVVALMREKPALLWIIVGFIMVNMALVGVTFIQLWLVRDLGLDAAEWARRIGFLGIVCGGLGSLAGGALGDRLSRRLPGGYAGFLALLALVFAPMMMAMRFADPGSPLFYVGLCACLFLPLAALPPILALIQGQTPPSMRSTMTGVAIMANNLIGHALGSVVMGAVSDHLTASNFEKPLTWVLLTTDLVVLGSAIFFIMAARGLRQDADPQAVAGN